MNTKRRWKYYGKKYLKKTIILVTLCCCFGISQVFSNTGDILSGTGVQEEPVVEIQPDEEALEIPDFKITFQNPSYILEREEQRSDYTCDNNKEECKINFKLQTSDDTDIGSKFICTINFGFESDQSSKCNPNTVIFPEGNTNVVFRISDKSDETNYKEKVVLIKKEAIQNEEPESEELVVNSGSVETNTGLVESGTGEIDTGSGISLIEMPHPIIDIQSGLEYSGSGKIWNCKKEDCKMNLTAVNTFTEVFLENDYECIWDFGGGVFVTSNTDKKCNPGYVTYGTGSFIVILNIHEKGNENNFKTSSITVYNGLQVLGDEEIKSENESSTGTIAPVTGGGGGGGSSSNITLKEILIQSGLDENNECNDERCKVNLEYENTSKETCEWNFGTAEFNDKYITTCNPGFIYFLPGDFRVGVKVFENGMLKGEKHLDLENIYLKIRQQNNLPPKSKITLQGSLSEKKFLVDSGIVCKDVDRCYLNFTGEDSSDPNSDNLIYNWNLGNGALFNAKNPNGVWYDPGKYSVSLKVIDIFGVSHESSFSIEVIGKENKNIIKEEVDNKDEKEEVLKHIEYFKNLKIKSVLVNPEGKDIEGEYIELENIGFTPMNLRGISLDDILEKGSKHFTVREDIILGAFQSYKIYRTDSKVALNNGSDEVHISYYDEPLDNISWDFSVPEGYALTKKDTQFLEYQVKVLRVVDGDTLVIQFEDERIEKLRLVGVDTPETKHPKKPVEFFGKEASNFTKQMLEGRTVILKQSVKNYRDKYNRLLGYVYLKEEEEEVFFNKLLVEKGYARAYLRFPFEYQLDFKKAENKAKREKVGMWEDGEIRKEILAIVREEKKLEKEEVRSYRKAINIKEIKIGKIVSSIQEEKENIYKEIGEIFTKEYSYFSQVWSEENARIREKKLPQKKKKSQNLKEEDKKQKIPFTKTVMKQKKSLKISGKTLPNTKIIVSGMGEDIILLSDSTGKYATNIYTGLQPGQYNLSFSIENKGGEIVAINRDKELILEEEYLHNMRKYYIPTVVKKKNKKAEKGEQKKDDSIKESSLETDNIEAKEDNNFSLLIANILTGLLVILGIFFLLRREKII